MSSRNNNNSSSSSSKHPPRDRDRDHRVAASQRSRSRSPYHKKAKGEGNHKKERRLKREREGVTQQQKQASPLIPAIWPKKQKQDQPPVVWPKEYHRKEGAKRRGGKHENTKKNGINNKNSNKTEALINKLQGPKKSTTTETLTNSRSQNEIDKERNSEPWLKEQQLFRECEIKYRHIIHRWEKAIKNENSNQLIRLYKKEFLGADNKIESFSAPFIEEYKLKKFIQKSKCIIEHSADDHDEDNDTKSIVKKVQDKFARTYGSKKRHVPEGFQAKKEWKEKTTDVTIDEFTGERIVKTVLRTENDIILERSRVNPKSFVNQQKMRDVLERVLDLGTPISYRQQFITATKSKAYMSQQIVAESMLKDVRKCLGVHPPVRFLRNIPKTQEFVEEKKEIARSALSNAISLYLPSSTSSSTSLPQTLTTDDVDAGDADMGVDVNADADLTVLSHSVVDADADADSDSTSDSDSDSTSATGSD